MNTTGAVLFAKQRDIVDGLHSQFRWVRGAEGRWGWGWGPGGWGPRGWGPGGSGAWLAHTQLLLCPAVCLPAGAYLCDCWLTRVVPCLLACPGPCRRKTVRKEYLALAVGVPAEAEFTVDAPIDRDDSNE